MPFCSDPMMMQRKLLSRVAAPSRWYAEPCRWLSLNLCPAEPRPNERPKNASMESGARSRHPRFCQTAPQPSTPSPGGPGGGLKRPPVPFGYFRAAESNRKTRVCGGGEVELKRTNREKHNPSGSFGPTSLCTREALAGCLLLTKFVPKERINSSLKKAALRGGLNPGRRTCRGFG